MLSAETFDTAHSVSDAVSDWLYREARSSANGRNRVLDNLEFQRSTIFNDINTFNVKIQSHSTRMSLWLEMLKDTEGRSDDRLAASIIFGGLMNISGAFRNQQMLEAANQSDYYDRRILSKSPADPVDVNIPNLMRRFISRNTETHEEGKVRLKDASADVLVAHGTSALEKHIELIDEVIGITRAEGFGVENSRAGGYTRALQTRWLGFTAHAIMHASAARNNELSAVPFLEPKSISDDPAVIYPIQPLTRFE